MAVFEAALPAGHWQTAEARTFLGLCLTIEGRYDEAEKQLLAGGPPDDAERSSQNRQALVYLYQVWGRPDQAQRYEK